MERKMRKGALLLRTRAVPGIASLQVASQFVMPAPPKVKIHSVAGHDEIKDAPTDSPEWEEYARQLQEIERKIEQARNDFMYDYSVEAWSWDDGKTWLMDAPVDWVFPDVFVRHGIKPSDNRRVDYIRYELVTSNEDMAILFADALDNAKPITDAEVSAASAGFRTDMERRRVAASKDNWYQRFKRALLGNGHSPDVGERP